MMKKYAVSEAIGQVIRQYRTNAGLTTKQLAHRIGISQQQLSRYERGVNRIDVDTLLRISLAFRLTPGRFFEEMNTTGTGLDDIIYENEDGDIQEIRMSLIADSIISPRDF
ncbi:TPA: helix-turn-helix transcriptional regulator [Morganella morganii]|uniref:helix-turn-helix domain-containing protein n=1 Tax=Morganella morganii TaxID=582 RepID=UPI00046975DB|nr:helix-turn-helix transcriptional regulator [Morganella morganii]HDF2342584.1 helix-turn-helix transcriptional regulator [Morganella morganii]